MKFFRKKKRRQDRQFPPTPLAFKTKNEKRHKETPRHLTGGRKVVSMKHGIVWWLLIGWWWYLCFAWWLYPIKWLLFGRSKKTPPDEPDGNGYDWRLLREAENGILDFLKKSNGGTALQVTVKNSLSRRLVSYFDDAVRELYQNGKIKTSKDGDRIRLELVGKVDAE